MLHMTVLQEITSKDFVPARLHLRWIQNILRHIYKNLALCVHTATLFYILRMP
jgi:hypothetical protein